MILSHRPWSRAFSHSLRASGADTIYALATANGKAGLGVIRVSGPATRQVLKEILPSVHYQKITLNPRWLQKTTFHDPASDKVLDHGMAVYFSSPASFTGEDVAELHIHSSRAVINVLYDRLSCLPSVRLADAGEFSRRAFLNGKLDLTQVEGLGDLLDAKTETQRDMAISQLAGSSRSVFESWRGRILQAMAMTEAWIDFSEDENIESDTLEGVVRIVNGLLVDISKEISHVKVGEIIKNGLRLALCGPPNAGKSSIMNKLVQREVAIVSPIAGTTRDILEVKLDIAGQAVVMMDTAGLREAQEDDQVNPIEGEGIRRALKAAETADHILFVIDSTTAATGEWREHLEKFDPSQLSIVLNKADLSNSLHPPDFQALLPPTHCNVPVLPHSCIDQGVLDRVRSEFLADLVKRLIMVKFEGDFGAVTIANERQKAHAQSALIALQSFLSRYHDDIVVGCEDLRQAAVAIGRITGCIDSEEVLDVLFSSFCIGK